MRPAPDVLIDTDRPRPRLFPVGRLVAFAATAALLAAACGSSSSEVVAPASPEEVPSSSTTTGEGTNRPGRSVDTIDLSAVETELDEDRLNEIVDLYLSFLWLTDEAVVDPPSEDLAAIVSDELLLEIEQARAANVELVDEADLLGAERRTSYAHPTRVDGVFEAATIVDCVEVEELNVLSQTTVRFVSQTVDVELVDGLLRVTSVSIANEGRIGDEPGCLPDYHLNRAEEAAELYLAEVAEARAEPTDVLPAGLAAVVDDPLREQITQALSDQASIGVALATPEEHQVEAVGRETQQLGLVVTVATCTHLPEGRSFTSLADGESIVLGAEMDPGTAISADLFVRLGPVASSDRVFGFTEARTESTCWEDGQ